MFRASNRIYIQKTTVGEHSSQNAARCELLHGPIALRPGIYLRHTDVVKSVDRRGTLPVAGSGGDARGASDASAAVRAPADAAVSACNADDVRAVPVSGTAGAVTTLGSERGTRARIEVRTARRMASRGRGRPAKLFAITDAGRSAFEHAYDDLATSALRFLAEVAGPGAVAEFARRQVAELERRYRQVMESAGEDKVKALAEALSADGYAASATSAPTLAAGGGEQLCQHHCPVAHVDGICTTHVTAPALVHIRPTTTTTS